jgi:predicted ArsR family transcriptional regulator
MRNVLEHSDGEFLNELHRLGPRTVQEICEAVGVTPTAIRQRLNRLQGSNFVVRELVRSGRGRPHYVYKVSEKGLRQLGENYGDLALILWRELHRIPDDEIRRDVTSRVRDALVARLGRFHDGPVAERLMRVSEVLLEHGYDVELGENGPLPILRENNCPYQELAEEDRGICELEQDVLGRVLGADVRLTQCCLDGHHCCEFQVTK